MPRISVIIVLWNCQTTLQRCLEAVAAQHFRDFELILLDNHSDDQSLALARDFLDQHAIITSKLICLDENSGFAAGVNRAAQEAQGQWLALLNPDAYADPLWLEKLATASETYADYTAFGSVQLDAARPDHLDGLGDVYAGWGIAWRGGHGQSTSLIPAQPQEIFAPCAAAALYRRDRFVALGGFDESFFCYHEDVDLGFRLRLSGDRALLVPEARVHHEGSATTGRRSDFAVYHGTRNRIRTFIKNMPGWLMPILLPLHLLLNLLLLLRTVPLGVAKPFAMGLWDGLWHSKAAWRARPAVQKAKTVSPLMLAKALCWSPLKFLKRAPDLRPFTLPPEQ